MITRGDLTPPGPLQKGVYTLSAQIGVPLSEAIRKAFARALPVLTRTGPQSFAGELELPGTARLLSISAQMIKLKWIAYLCLVRSRTRLLAGRAKQLSSHRATFG
jgi:hypothetical protein